MAECLLSQCRRNHRCYTKRWGHGPQASTRHHLVVDMAWAPAIELWLQGVEAVLSCQGILLYSGWLVQHVFPCEHNRAAVYFFEIFANASPQFSF